MRLRKHCYKQYELVYFAAYSVFLFFSILMQTFFFQYFVTLYKPIIVICIVLLLAKEVLCRAITRKTVWGVAVLYLLAAQIIYRGSGAGQISFACVFLFAFGARNIDFKRTCRVSLFIMTIVLLFVVISSLVGIIPNYRTVTASRTREYLGFRYALFAPSVYTNIIFLVIYLQGRKFKWTDALVLFMGLLFIYRKTNARLTFALSSMTIVAALFYSRHRCFFHKHRFFPAIMTTAFIVASIFSLVITIRYNPHIAWMNKLNIFLGDRLELGQTSLSKYGVSLFGNANIEWIGNGLDINGQKTIGEYLYVDNLYIQILQRYGIIFMAAYICLGTFSMLHCYAKADYLLLLLLAVRAMHGLIDDQILYLQFNTFELLFGVSIFGYIYERKKQFKIKIHFGDCQAVQ